MDSSLSEKGYYFIVVTVILTVVFSETHAGAKKLTYR